MLKILITCNKCFKHYIGQTVDTFRNRSSNYKDNSTKYDRGQHCMQKYLYEHIDFSGHTNILEHVTATLIDKTDLRNPIK